MGTSRPASNRLAIMLIQFLFCTFGLQLNEKMSKGITDADKYEFKLGNELKRVAEIELRETKSARDFALNAMREWIKTNPRIVAVRMGKKIILIFVIFQCGTEHCTHVILCRHRINEKKN